MSHLCEQGLRLQDVLLHLVSIGLHAGNEHCQLIARGPEGGSSTTGGWGRAIFVIGKSWSGSSGVS